MKRSGFRWAWAAALAAATAGCPGPSAPVPTGRLQVVASIFPLADVARQVGGEGVDVVMLLSAGQSPHGFALKPRQAEQVDAADLLLLVGRGLDVWAARSAAAAGKSGQQVLVMTEAVAVPDLRSAPAEAEHTAEEDHDEHGHAGADPHVWLDPVVMKAYVGVLAERLGQLDAERAADYRRRAADYAAKLDDLDREYRQTLSRARIRAFVSYHSAFTYLAARYGLTQEAVFEVGRAGTGPRHLEAVVAFIRRHGIKVVFVEPQFPPAQAQDVARETGVTIQTLDPIGNPGQPGHDSYLALMRTNLAALAEALEVRHVEPALTRPATRGVL